MSDFQRFVKKHWDAIVSGEFADATKPAFPLGEISATSDAMDSRYEYHLIDCNGDLIKILNPEGEIFQYYSGMRLKIVDKSGLPPGTIRIDL